MRPSESRQMVEEIGHVRGDLGVGGEQSVILVASCGEGVVVAGAEVDIPAELPAFTSHDERRLCVDLEIWKPVDNMDAGLLEGARPTDVAVLIEACLELDQRHTLLSLLRGLDERGHHRRVLACPVESRLDRENRRVARRCQQEGFEARRERVEWVMDEDVAAPDLGEKVVRVRRRRKAGMGHRHPAFIFQVGPVEIDQFVQVGQVEQSRDQVDLVARDAEPALEPFQHPGGDGARDLDADDVTEAPPAQLVLDRFEQVVGLVGDLEVGVPGDAECAALEDLHLREQAGQEVPDDPLERDEEPSVTHGQEARQELRAPSRERTALLRSRGRGRRSRG